VHNTPAVAPLSARDRYLIVACLAVITALAWAYLVYLANRPPSTWEYTRAMATMVSSPRSGCRFI